MHHPPLYYLWSRLQEQEGTENVEKSNPKLNRKETIILPYRQSAHSYTHINITVYVEIVMDTIHWIVYLLVQYLLH